MKKRIELYPLQLDFFNSQQQYTGFIAGIGSGKTFVGSLKAIYEAQPKTLGLITAPTYGMLRDSTLRTFRELAGEAVMDFQDSKMTALMRGGGEILFRSADDPEKLRGPNLHWAWIDEGGLTHKDTWRILIGRLRADGKFGKCWTTSTPKGKRNWLYDEAKNMEVFRATTMDNPFTSEEWKQSLLGTYTGTFLQQEIYGEFISFEGLVYPMFDAAKHIKRIDLTHWDSYGLGIDDGYTNPAVILKIYENYDGNYHVKEEWYQRGKLQEEIVSNAVRMADGMSIDIGIDSAAASLRAAIKDKGLNANGETSSVLAGIKRIQELLAHNKITIDPSCVNLINELESYAWKDHKDEPVKEFDHAADALRYYINRKRKRELVAKQRRY